MPCRSIICNLFTMILLVSISHAQTSYQASGRSDSIYSSVLARPGKNRLHITASGLVQRIRLEVIGQNGEQIYNSDFQSGSTMEWNYTDSRLPLVENLYYGCLVTIEDLAGNFGHRSGLFSIKERQIVFERPGAQNDSDASETLLSSEESSPLTLLAHDGNDGWILTGKGGLSFRSQNSEQMRLAPDGNLGIGTNEPQAKLDVSGLIRTSEGIMFPDGTIQKTAAGVALFSNPGEGFFPKNRTNNSIFSENSAAWINGSMQSRNEIASMNSPATEDTANTFYGQGAGASNTGQPNAFFGSSAGYFNSTGNYNSFFGPEAGKANTVGTDNAFFGFRAGFHNTASVANSFFGSGAGFSNTGRWNSFFGMGAGLENTTGESNLFLGFYSGQSNTTESANTFIGCFSDGAGGATNASAIGAFAKVTQSNSLVLGSISGVNGATVDAKVGIGTTSPDRQLVVEGGQALLKFRRYYATAIHAPALLMEHARGSRSAPEDILPGDYLGKIQFRGRVAGGANDGYPEYGIFAFVASDKNGNGRFSFIDKDMTTEKVSISNSGNLGIGTTNPVEKLHVVGNIKATGSILYSALEEVPDYVFEPNYRLMPIRQLENYLATEKHLPNVPSAAEIKQKGLNLSEFQMKLLEKIEELTLYIVDQSKKIDAQEKIINRKQAEIFILKSQNSNLDTRLSALEQLLGKENRSRRVSSRDRSECARSPSESSR